MKFSVVIPVFNCELYVGECIESILGQTYEDLEVIVVDDGSTDGTLSVCESFEANDERVKVVHQGNRGPFAARIAAYPFLTGEYVLHVDADDRLRANALETLLPIVSGGHFDVVFFEYSSTPDFSKMVKRFPFTDSKAFDPSEKVQYLNLAFSTHCLHNMWSKAIRADLLKNTLYPDDAIHLISGEDHLQSLLILNEARTAYYLMVPLYYYRDNQDGTTRTFRLSDYLDFQIKVKYSKQLLSRWRTLPGFNITDNGFDEYILTSSLHYLANSLRDKTIDAYSEALVLVLQSPIFRDAMENKKAVKMLRLDKRIVLRLVEYGHTNLAKTFLSFLALLATYLHS